MLEGQIVFILTGEKTYLSQIMVLLECFFWSYNPLVRFPPPFRRSPQDCYMAETKNAGYASSRQGETKKKRNKITDSAGAIAPKR